MTSVCKAPVLLEELSGINNLKMKIDFNDIDIDDCE